MKNELEIQKKGNCKKDKRINIDKTKDGDICLETDVHNIILNRVGTLHHPIMVKTKHRKP